MSRLRHFKEGFKTAWEEESLKEDIYYRKVKRAKEERFGKSSSRAKEMLRIFFRAGEELLLTLGAATIVPHIPTIPGKIFGGYVTLKQSISTFNGVRRAIHDCKLEYK
jgi:hypothetical protein